MKRILDIFGPLVAMFYLYLNELFGFYVNMIFVSTQLTGCGLRSDQPLPETFEVDLIHVMKELKCCGIFK